MTTCKWDLHKLILLHWFKHSFQYNFLHLKSFVNSKIWTEKVPSNQQHFGWCKSDLNWGSLDIWICQCDLLSVCWCFFVLRIWQCEKVFKLPLQGFERGSLHWVLVPALQHNVVEGWRTARRTLHPVAVFHLVQYLGVGHSCKEKHERFKSSFTILEFDWLLNFFDPQQVSVMYYT